ncbi:hypothetical protein BDF21DRAFT_425231 [Thamnidium elegans]|uniref:Uncharacterized protein n=1 Tax=Thamnidium elegans TaxID=101142 RepID=A0A8H7W0N6_9FUNG|nr:hypothetical protein INT48_002322 [Thamnidium elegans]KAI8070221.1 hypothetical protein BDF21DRAFT_425231 [Thamnidium elegans]
MSQFRRFFQRSTESPEVLPLITILSVALAGAGFMTIHQARSPDVVWNHKTNSEPWQHVREGDRVKLAAYNQKYERPYHRTEW